MSKLTMKNSSWNKAWAEFRHYKKFYAEQGTAKHVNLHVAYYRRVIGGEEKTSYVVLNFSRKFIENNLKLEIIDTSNYGKRN